MTGALVMPAILLLTMIALSRSVNARLPEGEVPVRFDLRGRAVAFGSRWIVLGVMPVFYALMLGVTAATGWLPGGETAVGKIPAAQLILGFALLATHVFELWLLLRWVRDKGAE